MLQYWSLFKSFPKAITFGFLQNFFGGFGQTFFVSLFIGQILQQFTISKTAYGSIYAVATFLAALALPYWGKLIDRQKLNSVANVNAFGLIIASILLALAPNLIILFLAFFFLRLFGQAAMPLLGQTAMSKHFHQSRGKALALASLGAPVSEAIFPPLVAVLLLSITWQQIWFGVVALVVLIYIPLVKYLCANMRTEASTVILPTDSKLNGIKDWTLNEVLKDYRFYLLIPAGVYPAFCLTASFFYQIPFAEERGWSLTFIATAFSFFALLRFAFALIGGPYVDKISAFRVIRFYLLPIIAGFCCIGFFEQQWAAFAYFILSGISVGIGANAKSAIWAELYGTKNLGQIKGIFSFIGVTATAISPAIFGYWIDSGNTVTQMFQLFVVFGIIGQFLLLLIRKEA